MARDYENLHDLDDLSDDELRDLVMEQLREDPSLDADDITATVSEGVVCLDGRVGTESERRIAERIVDDVTGVDRVVNRIFVDPTRRAQTSEAVDEHLAEEDRQSGRLLGDRPVPFEPSAEHLSEELDDEARAFGTSEVQESIEKGAPWIPPERPTPEGLAGDNPDTESLSEEH